MGKQTANALQTLPQQTAAVPVRQRLVSMGYDTKNIGWNPQTGSVTYSGSDLLKPQYATDGTSYAQLSDITNALKQNNLAAGQANAPYQVSLNDLLSRFNQQSSRPFQYNPQADPQYQALLQQAQRGAQQATRTAEEELNARGILNSTVTSDRLGQIQQQAQQSVTDLIPQLQQQAYSQRQNELNNLLQQLGLYQGLEAQQYERGFNQQQFTEQQRQFNQQYGLQEQQLQAELENNKFYRGLQQQQLDLQKQQQNLENAWNRVNQLGYVDNQASTILGIKVGTPSAQARQAAEELANRIRLQQIQAGTQMAAISKEYALRAQERAQEAAQNQTAQQQAFRSQALDLAQKEFANSLTPPTADQLNERANYYYNYLVGQTPQAGNTQQSNQNTFQSHAKTQGWLR